MILSSGILHAIIKGCSIDIRIYFECINKIQSKFNDALYKTIPVIRDKSGLTPRVSLPLKNNWGYYLEPQYV